MIKMPKKVIWAALFIIAAAAGAFALTWLLRSGTGDPNSKIVNSEEISEAEEDMPNQEDGQEEYIKDIPPGMKEINLPVSYYGDHTVLEEGNRVDIISTYYKEDAGSLSSERIIMSSEIIRLEAGGSQGSEGDMSLGDALVYDGISRTAAIDMGKILVLTFFLTDEEVLKSFTALESGMLYIALCPAYGPAEWRDD